MLRWERERLIWLGIQTRVLKIDWGTHERLAELPNFESLARRYRFRALGKACRDAGINSLFLAHHQDDQVETVMMRMINGHRIFGLRGMKRDCEIPECHGIHGVHESGALDTTKDHAVSASPQVLQRKQDTRRKRFQPKINLATEMGGVRVYRPLLGFTKSRLIDTCTAAKMEWFEDHTNKDPTITMRNAIRHMYSTYAMPTALKPLSMLSLSEKFEKKHDHLQKVADSLFEAANKLFMTRSGTMIIKFPDLRFLESSLSPDDLKLVASLLLRQAISFVTPQEHARLQSLHGSVRRVFPEILKDIEPSEPVIFTVSGVQFKPMPPSTSHQESEARREWYLSRQLYSSAGSDRPDIDLSTYDVSHRDGSWTPWMLYDGRFWFRIQKNPCTPLTLRPLQKEDMVDFKKGLGRFDQLRFKDILRQVAPADVRWTLPAIAHKEWNGKEIVVALPTVDLAIEDSQRLVEWEVRYKKVDVDILKGGGTEII